MSLDPFDPFTPTFLADPYALYARYRPRGPVHWGVAPSPLLPGAWYVLGHAEVMAALEDPRLGREARKVLAPELLPAVPPGYAPFAAMFRKWLVFLDPPDHTRLRRLVNRSFTPEVIARLRPRVRALAHEQVDRFAAKGRVELVSELALPLPIVIIAELLGAEPEARDRYAAWSQAMSRGNNLRRPAPPGVYAEASAAAIAMGDHLRAAAAERRRAPRDDLLSRLVLAEDEGGRLSEDELAATCVHLLTAGHETVVNLIAKGTLALLRDPAAAARAASGAVPLERVVEELLRLDAPVQLVSRWALEDLRLGGVDVRRGDGVMLALGAANRDPSVFTRPDVIDFDRAPARHATFGLGIHYCLGAALAKMEGEVAFEVLLSRLPGMRWEEQALSYRESVVFHGLERLEVVF